ncbi:MAG: Rrf2 family transcriptional regulator [Candidatus Omnitrophota bacterium]
MKLSTRARYGTRLMIELASRFGKGLVYLKEIARGEDISEKYLSQLVIPLRNKGLITSYRGANGGYELSRPPSQITLKEIVEPLEGDLALMDCHSASNHKRASDFVAMEIWCRLGGKIAEFLESISLEDLVRMRNETADRGCTYTI